MNSCDFPIKSQNGRGSRRERAKQHAPIKRVRGNFEDLLNEENKGKGHTKQWLRFGVYRNWIWFWVLSFEFLIYLFRAKSARALAHKGMGRMCCSVIPPRVSKPYPF